MHFPRTTPCASTTDTTTQRLFEDDGLSSVFPLLAHVEVPSGLKQGGERIEQNLSATVIADQIKSW